MLKNLYINNFAIIDELSIDFDRGYNVITGETGSGKSLLVEAILLLSGDRIDKALIGKRRAYSIVEGVFSASLSYEYLESLNIEPCDEIVITRKFSNSSSSIRINNRVSNLSILKDLAKGLLDVYGQHSSIVLFDKKNYLAILDAYGDKIKELEDLSKIYKENISLYKQLEDYSLSDEELFREKDLISYQIEEIDNFNFDIDEEEITNEYKRLNNSVEIAKLTNLSSDLLNGNAIPTVLESVKTYASSISDIARYDKAISNLEERAYALIDELEVEFDELQSYYETIEYDPERMGEIDKYLSDLFKIKNKYGKDIDEIKNYYENISTKLEDLNNYEENKEKIRSQIDKNERLLLSLAKIISEKRKEKAGKFTKRMIRELKELNLLNIEFEIKFDSKDKVSENGFDEIDFMISTNLGEEKKSLSTVASGGEISRFMLAFKSVIADIDEVETLIFDEIDTGISGRTAQIVAEKLLDISQKHQILVISHLGQIAAMADSHYLIEKHIKDKNTFSNIRRIENSDRTKEMARLIGGVNITGKTLSSAEEMLDLAYEKRVNYGKER